MVAGLGLFGAAGAVQAASSGLTPDIVKSVFQKDVRPECRFEWKNIQIGGPRRASVGEIRAAGLPPNATITPVRVEYTKACNPGYTRDYRWNYFFYKDDFGGWAMQSNATTGNYESDPR